jgi:hypothetical protein
VLLFFFPELALQHVSMIFRSEQQQWEVVEPLRDIGECFLLLVNVLGGNEILCFFV